MTQLSHEPQFARSVARLRDAVAGHRIPVSRALVLLFVAALLAAGSRHEGSLFSSFVFLLGVVLAGVATVGRLWCSLYISGNKDSELVTTGPYSICRNPLYLFSLVGMAGLGFATETLTLGLALPAVFVPVYGAVVRREEEYLRRRFGPRFEAYLACTPRFLPRPALHSEPGSCQVNPRIFRRALVDVVWFVWGLGLVRLVVAAHELRVFEPVFRLP